LVVSKGRIIYRKGNKKLCFWILPLIGRKEIGKAEDSGGYKKNGMKTV
jgi:hypothetical protein